MKRFRELIDQVGKPSLTSRRNVDEATIQATNYVHKEEVREYLRNPQADREAIESIDSVYFDAFANVDVHELERFEENATINDVETRRRRLRMQMNAVSKKLSDVILENQPSYTKELKDVQELQRSLHNAFVICSNGRRFLNSVSQRSTRMGLALLSNQQKRQKLVALHSALQTIKTLQHTDIRLREMLDEEDYDGAMQLCLECQQAAATYRHYNCIKDLSTKLQDTVDLIEEQIDVALSKTCQSFDEVIYAKLQMAYQLLGKTQSAMDQLLMHYTTAIHNTAFQVVLGYAELSNSDSNLNKKQYKDICSHINDDMYIPCLMELCKALWSVMHCYHKTSKWHLLNDESVFKDDLDLREYVNRKLAHGRHRVWSDVQSRIRTYILSADLSRFMYDDFITVLDIVKRFISVGEDFCFQNHQESESQQISDNLNEPLRKQTLSYFNAYHHKRLEEMLMFLDNEIWNPCPVKQSFTVLGMQEFKFLKSEESFTYSNDDPGEDNIKNFSGSKYFDPYLEEGHPFSDLEKLKNNTNTDANQTYYNAYEGSDEDEEELDELRQDFIDEKTGETPTSSSSSYSLNSLSNSSDAPIMTNTALHVLRLCGSYMKMCDVLKPIAIDVIVCLSQLFDLYFYAVHNFFSTEEERRKFKYERLPSTIQRIEESLFHPIVLNHPNGEVDHVIPKDSGKIRRPSLNQLVKLDHRDNFYGISERIVAAESLVYLSVQLQSLRKHLEQMVPQSKKAFLHQFYSQTVNLSSEVRWPVYYGVSVHSVNFSSAVDEMSSVNWDIREIMSQHNHYVDKLLNELQHFKTTLHQSFKLVRVPSVVSKVMWEHCIIISNQVFVEGFSNAKKCSNEGRALMQLDYQQFLMKLEKLTNIRPIPNREYVEAYIKAYYLTESDLESWMQNHAEYSSKQLSALVACTTASYAGGSASAGNRKTKQRMISLIEELTNRK